MDQNQKNPTNNAGKGDSYRPVNRKRYEENFERIFGRKKVKYENKTILKN